jgi:hypothetical protein
VLATYVARSAVVGLGMAAAGKRKHLLRDTLIGTAVIEAVVLAYFSTRPPSDTTLPTQHHVSRFLQGDTGAVLPIAQDIAGRALEIGAGMYLAGSRKHLVRDSLGGSLAVEALLVAYAVYFGKPCRL